PSTSTLFPYTTLFRSFLMAGVGTLLKQAQKMQRGIEALQAQLEAKEIEVTSGGGAVKIKVSGSGKFLALTLDPEFLKEDAKLVRSEEHTSELSHLVIS